MPVTWRILIACPLLYWFFVLITTTTTLIPMMIYQQGEKVGMAVIILCVLAILLAYLAQQRACRMNFIFMIVNVGSALCGTLATMAALVIMTFSVLVPEPLRMGLMMMGFACLCLGLLVAAVHSGWMFKRLASEEQQAMHKR